MINPGQVAMIRQPSQRERREADERLGQVVAKWRRLVRRRKGGGA